MTPIPELCARIGLTNPRTLVEVGAAHPATYRLGHYVHEGRSKVILIEASPRLHYCLTKGYNLGDFQKEWPNPPAAPYTFAPVAGPKVQIIHAAVADQAGTIKVYECNASTFVGGVNSPARQNDGYIEQAKDVYEVPSIQISSIDDGEIDVLLADVEGCEWFCIKTLVSRPKLIVLELQGQRYINPHLSEIVDWMTANRYGVIEQDATDVAFVKLP